MYCRYKLVHPSSQYSSTYSSVQTKADMCVRCRAALCSQPSAAVDAVQQSVLAGQRLGGSSSTCYSVQQLLDDVRFLAGQMKTLQQVNSAQHPLVCVNASVQHTVCACYACLRLSAAYTSWEKKPQ